MSGYADLRMKCCWYSTVGASLLNHIKCEINMATATEEALKTKKLIIERWNSNLNEQIERAKL